MKQECNLYIDCNIISGEVRDKLIDFGINSDCFVQRKSYDEYYFRPASVITPIGLSIADLNNLAKIGKVLFYEGYNVELVVD